MAHRGIRLLAFCLSFIFITSLSRAQRCETYEYAKKYPATNSAFNNRITDQDKSLRDTIANEVITIPVVVHVLYNNAAQNISDAQIFSQLETLNNDYRRLNADRSNTPTAFASLAGDARIVFCLAKIDASGKATTGIIRKYTSTQSWLTDDEMKYSAQGGDNTWDSKRYLNIWVCNLFGRSLGYSSLPGSQADRDGVVIQYYVFGTTGNVTTPFNKGRTLTHEVGHWLGLKHLWGDASCGDDGIPDTPLQQTFNNGCPSFPHKSSCSINGNGDMFMNFLDFSDDACMNMFSKGQVVRMRSLFAAGGTRNSFLNSTVCDSNSVQRAAAVVAQPVTEASISLFPNPAINSVTIEARNASDLIGKTVKICNAYGEVVISQFVSTQKITIAVQHLTRGVYYLKIGNGKIHKPIIFVKK
ncbi:MAG TPA: M43 family zinc metalloprotease [Chitinophagaceae bacterium]|nr:M43 family zinc metalloprotease [Chitinophagaceae bacterium]